MSDLTNILTQYLSNIKEKLLRNQTLDKEDLLYLYLASVLEEDAKQ
jgi:uncharacterized coiled-coil DUF342 family protein